MLKNANDVTPPRRLRASSAGFARGVVRAPASPAQSPGEDSEGALAPSEEIPGGGFGRGA